MTHEYDDIINLPCPTSKTRPRMSMYQRAAQFAPFAALTGHDAAIRETARLTDSMVELSDDDKRILDEKIQAIIQHVSEHPNVSITHFVADSRKSGGTYTITEGTVKKWDEYQRLIIFDNDCSVHIQNVLDIQTDLIDDDCLD